jgi:HD-GYP domain-containing protein (c-di-GMP phosphodiesterase class II)
MSFVPIRISLLRGDQKIGFDCYIEVGGRHIHYLRKGGSFGGGHLARLKDKKLKKLFMREDEEALFRDYVSRNIDMAYDQRAKQPLEARTQIIQGLQQSNAEAVYENPADQAAYASAKEGSRRFTEFLVQEELAIKNLLALKNSDQSLAHHGVTVASLAVRIAHTTGYNVPQNLPLIALGGLTHDLGHYMSGQNISRPLKDFSPEELAVYRSHPVEGAKKLKDLKHMDLHVTQIILEHEESVNGSGFPDHKNEKKMNPMSVFVQTANIYDRLVTFEGVSHVDAIKRLLSAEFLGRFPLNYLTALKAIAATQF